MGGYVKYFINKKPPYLIDRWRNAKAFIKGGSAIKQIMNEKYKTCVRILFWRA